MQIERIFTLAWHKAARHLPAPIGRRIFKNGALASLIDVSAGSEGETVLVDLGDRPGFSMSLDIRNKGPFAVTVRNAEVQFWCCGAQLAATLGTPLSLAPGETRTVSVSDVISGRDARQIAANMGSHQFGVAAMLKCSCPLQDFFKATGYLASIKLKFVNAPPANTAPSATAAQA